jgi:hypothetical protein
MKIFQTSGVFTQLTSVTTTVTSDVLDITSSGGFSLTSNIAIDTNAAGTFAAASVASNHVTITAHGYKTGIVGQLTTAGSLPTGLATSTNYFIIVVDANTVKFASSYANAIAGTAITISGGSGNSTFTPTSVSASVQGQWSNDPLQVIWANDGSSTSVVTSPTVLAVLHDRPHYRFYRLAFTLTAGSLTLNTTYQINKDT